MEHDQAGNGSGEHYVEPAAAPGFGSDDVGRLDHDHVVVLEALNEAGREQRDIGRTESVPPVRYDRVAAMSGARYWAA